MATFGVSIWPQPFPTYWGDVKISWIDLQPSYLVFANSDGSYTRLEGTGFETVEDGMGGLTIFAPEALTHYRAFFVQPERLGRTLAKPPSHN